MGSIAAVGHRLLIGRPKAGSVGELEWFHALFQYPRSAVVAWPGKLVDLGPGRKGFLHDPKVLEPVLLPVCALEGLQAATFQWRSWLWQLTTLPIAMTKQVSVLPVLDREPLPVLHTMAHKAFWNMPRSDIVRFAALGGVVINEAASLCDSVLQAVQGILNVSDDQALDIVSQRVGQNDLPETWASTILEVDEAAQVLERSDMDLVVAEQREVARCRNAEASFVQAYRQRRFDAAARATTRPGKGGRRAQGKAKTAPAALPSSFDQRAVRQFCPPGAHIWKGVTKQNWNGHMENRRRVSANWHDGDEQQAIRTVLRKLWLQYVDIRGIRPEDTPWPELLQEP